MPGTLARNATREALRPRSGVSGPGAQRGGENAELCDCTRCGNPSPTSDIGRSIDTPLPPAPSTSLLPSPSLRRLEWGICTTGVNLLATRRWIRTTPAGDWGGREEEGKEEEKVGEEEEPVSAYDPVGIAVVYPDLESRAIEQRSEPRTAKAGERRTARACGVESPYVSRALPWTSFKNTPPTRRAGSIFPVPTPRYALSRKRMAVFRERDLDTSQSSFGRASHKSERGGCGALLAGVHLLRGASGI
ncbi:hypothetical protein DFH09DRAFT_653035 [Mycena vulgaris]|nr:hypothetical protein DFH09DRAFT_653035 [Mycena vulgaris]